MNIYVFASTSLGNIRTGIAHRMWAVPSFDEPHAAARMTRAFAMRAGSAGLFYASDIQMFTTPFVVESEPEDRAVLNVWENKWVLPFNIRPIGRIENMVTWYQATMTWPFVRDADNRGGLVTGARSFAPIFVGRSDWDQMLVQLGVDPEEHEDLF